MEFFPVEFKSARGSLKAALQVSARVGVNAASSLDTPALLDSVCGLIIDTTCPGYLSKCWARDCRLRHTL